MPNSDSSELHDDPFSSSTTVLNYDGEPQDQVVMRTWLGNLDGDKHDKEYVQQRANLANTAKYGRWDEVFDILVSARKTYGESWVNAPRISEYLTPLPSLPALLGGSHQADQIPSNRTRRRTTTHHPLDAAPPGRIHGRLSRSRLEAHFPRRLQ